MPKGYLNLVLHAHLPFVRHLDKDDRLEERWLFEAITETYIPLLQVLTRLDAEGADFRLTLSLSPPLVSMLGDSLLQLRYKRYLKKLLQLAELEVRRTALDAKFAPLALEYRRRFQSVSDFYQHYEGNLLDAFQELATTGKLELITSAATHAFLPYIQTDEALRAQIAVAVSVFESQFGYRPAGLWLPECAFTPRVLEVLREFSIRYFFVDTHTLGSAQPQPVFSSCSPILTKQGIAAFARDPECSRQVWSSETGYPGDYDYREYYRDIGFDLDEDYIHPFIHREGIRLNTGFKYYRITGKSAVKEPYDFQRAREKAADHAADFLQNRLAQTGHLQQLMGRIPVITAPYDAELFGHWWYEGPVFLDMLLRKIYYDQSDLTLVTASEYLALYPDFQTCDLAFSTWGRDGYGDVWLNGTNDFIYPALHDAEQRLGRVARRYTKPAAVMERVLNQAARELMLAESSDWAFIMDNQSTTSYAVERTKQHLLRFHTLIDMAESETVNEERLRELESVDNLFPDLDYRLYQRPSQTTGVSTDEDSSPASHLRILMLSWEFPPMSVGGLSRHVYDLTRHLVALGCEVHMVTTAIGDYPLDEVIEGVHVHRVRVLQPDGGAFIHFAFQLNLMMIDRCKELIEQEGTHFDIIHAHDWLVSVAAKSLKMSAKLPLVATIHATEHGRNHGIFTDTHRHIHHQEWILTHEAKRVIVCSSYMRNEVKELFSLSDHQVDIIPNGVDHDLLQVRRGLHTNGNLMRKPEDSQKTVLFVGRLVREKGVHLLLAAVPGVLSQFPDTRFVIIGKGPMMEELTQQTKDLHIENAVLFLGYADDDTRNELLHTADVAVFPSLYEPFGIVALEAMAAGTPVVVSDVGGLGDIVLHDHNGLLAYPDDPQSIACQIKRLLSDKEFSQQLAETALSELTRYDWRTIAKQTLMTFQKVIETSHFSAVTKS